MEGRYYYIMKKIKSEAGAQGIFTAAAVFSAIPVAAASEAETESYFTVDGGSALLIAAVVISLIFIGVLIAHIFLSNKEFYDGETEVIKENDTPEPEFSMMFDLPPIRPVMQRPKEPARIVASNRYYGRKIFRIVGSVKIGSDGSQCIISLPEDAKGISRVHCEIAYDGRECSITDLGSDGGTFVNGIRLEPNIPAAIESGGKFYLAEPENLFEAVYEVYE